MNYTIAAPIGMSKYKPLPHVMCYDDFDTGLNGWMDLRCNLVEPGFRPRKSIYRQMRNAPICLSAAAFGWAGTHGSMDGLYSLKLSTRPVADRYENMPMPGASSMAIKRLTFQRPLNLVQYETWFSYTVEQDRFGHGEKDFRAISFCMDIQDGKNRYVPGIRYVNSVNGKLVKRWQYSHSIAKSDEEWGYDQKGEWFKNGVDPQWFGKRRPDGSCDSFQWLGDEPHELCYNETDDKINWIYFRMTFDLAKREYVEMECQGRTFDMRGLAPTMSPCYSNIDMLINPFVNIENDTNRRCYMYMDSFCLSFN